MHDYAPSSETLEENSAKFWAGGRETEEDAAVSNILKMKIIFSLDLFGFSVAD